MDKSLGTLLRFWGVFQFTQVQHLPSPHKQCWTRVSRIFFRDSTLYRVGGGRTKRKFRKGCTVLRGNREMTEKYEYCSTVRRTFVQDCSSSLSITIRKLGVTTSWKGDSPQNVQVPVQNDKWIILCMDSPPYSLSIKTPDLPGLKTFFFNRVPSLLRLPSQPPIKIVFFTTRFWRETRWMVSTTQAW